MVFPWGNIATKSWLIYQTIPKMLSKEGLWARKWSLGTILPPSESKNDDKMVSRGPLGALKWRPGHHLGTRGACWGGQNDSPGPQGGDKGVSRAPLGAPKWRPGTTLVPPGAGIEKTTCRHTHLGRFWRPFWGPFWAIRDPKNIKSWKITNNV